MARKRITQSVIDYALCIGSGFENGKSRIVEQFAKCNDLKANANFLKQEYGTGGCTICIGDWNDKNNHFWQDHNASGLSVRFGYINDAEKEEVKMNWYDVAKRIRELIRKGKYRVEKREVDVKPSAEGILKTKDDSGQMCFQF